ncbi:hypothetical protein ACJX0J_025850, partial [Zea mays]
MAHYGEGYMNISMQTRSLTQIILKVEYDYLRKLYFMCNKAFALQEERIKLDKEKGQNNCIMKIMFQYLEFSSFSEAIDVEINSNHCAMEKWKKENSAKLLNNLMIRDRLLCYMTCLFVVLRVSVLLKANYLLKTLNYIVVV